MRRVRPLPSYRGLAAAASIVLGLLIAACGGGGAPQRPTPPVVTATAESFGAIPLDRFHYVVTLTMREEAGKPGVVIVSTAGDFESPDRHAFTHNVRLGQTDLPRSAVIIGEEVWYRLGDLEWRETTLGDPDVSDLLADSFTTVRSDFLGGPAFAKVRESVRRLTPIQESANGVAASHYQVSATGRAFFAALLEQEELLRSLDDITWDLWLADDGGWPVRLLVTATVPNGIPSLDLEGAVEWELRIDVSQPNDPALSVAPPAQGG
ncbi:MAG: hypothetical protein IH958_04660 [Chloroflexi bacterium]|nr:hypothetical protein [Chloroflexota bacterium]